MIEVAHQRRAGLPVGDVLGRTAHVDVDDLGARAFGDARALRHPARLAAGKLDNVDADTLSFGAQHSIAAAFDQRIACGHFGDDKTGAKLRYQTTKRGIGDARHRRQHDVIPHCNGADAERGCLRCLVFFAVFPIHALPIF